VQATVEAELTDGRKVSVRCEHPLGSPEHPLTRAQIETKFRTYAKARLPAERVEQVLRTVAELEALPSVATLMAQLRAA
jgi:2-methylcitrate dehydratase PrpD